MKLLKITIAFLLLVSLQIAAAQWLNVPPPVEARGLMMVGGGVPVAGGPSTLYTNALVVWDFENNSNDTKGTAALALGATGSPTSNVTSPSPPVGTYWSQVSDGNNWTISNANADAFDFTSDYSVSLWVRFPSVGGAAIIGNYNGANGWMLQISYTDPSYRITVMHASGWSETKSADGPVPSDNTTYHICYAYSDAGDTITMWVSTSTFGDVANGSSLALNKTPAASTNSFGVGDGSVGYGEVGMAGYLDEVVIWGSAINATNAAALFAKNWR